MHSDVNQLPRTAVSGRFARMAYLDTFTGWSAHVPSSSEHYVEANIIATVLRDVAVVHEPHSLRPSLCTLTGKVVPTEKRPAGTTEHANNE